MLAEHFFIASLRKSMRCIKGVGGRGPGTGGQVLRKTLRVLDYKLR